MTERRQMRVRLIMPTKTCHGNIIWTTKHAARNGRFPLTHPVAPGAAIFGGADRQFGSSDKMQAFRERGYWASCFPEGDGITFSTEHGVEKVKADIEEVFGFEVKS